MFQDLSARWPSRLPDLFSASPLPKMHHPLTKKPCPSDKSGCLCFPRVPVFTSKTVPWTKKNAPVRKGLLSLGLPTYASHPPTPINSHAAGYSGVNGRKGGPHRYPPVDNLPPVITGDRPVQQAGYVAMHVLASKPLVPSTLISLSRD